MSYKITSITDRNGNPRTDGHYPLRIGRTCMKPEVRIGEPMSIQYVANADGSPYDGVLNTSMVVSCLETADIIIVTTRNSVYTFVKL